MVPACCFSNLNFCPGYYYLFFQCQIRREDGDMNGWKAVLRRNKWGVQDYKNTLLLVMCAEYS